VFPIFGAFFYWIPKMTGRMYDERLGRLSFALTFVGFQLAFFPMHISGLLGMPRRVYTYDVSLHVGFLNLLSTIGAFLFALGVLAVIVAIVHTILVGRGEAGPDPWGANTLEWVTTSPPAPYTFAVIPTVTSSNPNWDRADREADRRRAERGELVLDSEHETLESTTLEGEPEEVLHMPEASIFPILLALSLAVFFGGFVAHLWVISIIGVALSAAALAGWHKPKPELQDQ
jgi:cytochrome c oxidase subunit I+III